MKKRNLLFLIFLLAIVFVLLLTQVKKDIEPEELKDKYTDDLSKFIKINGLEVHYKDVGESQKPVLLLLHGIASSLHTWDSWTAELSKHYRIISLDLPGGVSNLMLFY
ncbi:MAG: alpha/beta fold hydrolase [Chitinophagales bacterium]